MSKKLLSVVLALALVLSSFAVSAFAVGGIGYEDDEDAGLYTQEWALTEPTDIGGGKYTVDVLLTANYEVGPIEFQILKNVTAGSLALTGAAEGSAIPENWIANVAFDNATGKVAIIPDPVEDGVDAIDNPNGAVIAKLTFTASADVAATVAINVADAKSATNPGGTLIAARMSDGNVVTGTAITGQTVSQNTNTVTFGNAAPPAQAPELAVIDGTIGVIDTSRTMLDEWDIDGDGDMQEIDGYLFGFDPDMNASLDELFTVVGDGEIVIEASVEGSEAATGTMVYVVDLDGNTVATYVVIVFGDVNGDGFADGTDASIIEQHDAWMLGDYGRLYSYQEVAADIFVDGGADGTDASNIEQHDAWMLGDLGRIDVAGIIAELGL